MLTKETIIVIIIDMLLVFVGGQNMENIGEKIMQARKTKGMTQDTLAQLVNVSRQTVSHWENGRAMPDVATRRSCRRYWM